LCFANVINNNNYYYASILIGCTVGLYEIFYSIHILFRLNSRPDNVFLFSQIKSKSRHTALSNAATPYSDCSTEPRHPIPNPYRALPVAARWQQCPAAFITEVMPPSDSPRAKGRSFTHWRKTDACDLMCR